MKNKKDISFQSIYHYFNNKNHHWSKRNQQILSKVSVLKDIVILCLSTKFGEKRLGNDNHT